MASLKDKEMNERNEDNQSPLINDLIVENLLKKGVDPSVSDAQGNTALHKAVSEKNYMTLEALLKNSSREKLKKFIDAKTKKDGYTALHIACNNSCIASVRLLLCRGANFEVKSNNDKLAIDLASDQKIRELLVNVAIDSKLAANGKYSMLHSRLLEYPKFDLMASCYARNKHGMTGLQMAVLNNHCNTVYRIVEIRIDRLQGNYTFATENAPLDDLIAPGKKVSEHQSSLMLHSQDTCMMDGESITDEIAIILAASHQVIKIAEKVFKPANEQSYEQSRILDVVEEVLQVLQFQPEHLRLDQNDKLIFSGHEARYYKRLYVDDGTLNDYDKLDAEPKVISYMAILQVSISRPIAMFMRSIFNIKMIMAAKANDMHMFEKCIEEQFIDVNVRNEDHLTPLHYAADNGNEAMVKMLLNKEAIVNCRCKKNGETPVHFAAAKGHARIIRLMLQRLSDMEATACLDTKTTDEGWTSLHLAAKNSHLEALKCLLEYRSMYDLKDANGEKPMGLSDNKSVVGFLRNIEEMFDMADNGDTSLLQKLSALKADELLAIGCARNSSGHTIADVAQANNHLNISSKLRIMLKQAIPVPPEPHTQDFNDAYHEMEMYQLLDTLSQSST